LLERLLADLSPLRNRIPSTRVRADPKHQSNAIHGGILVSVQYGTHVRTILLITVNGEGNQSVGRWNYLRLDVDDIEPFLLN